MKVRREGRASWGGYAIRPYGRILSPSCRRGGLYGRPSRTAGITGLAVTASRPWRHVSMPPYGVGRGCSRKGRPAGADMQSAPTDVSSPLPVVGAAYMAARAALPESLGLRLPHPGHGGMWACRPTALDGGAAGKAGLFGRICNPPLRRYGALFVGADAHIGPLGNVPSPHRACFKAREKCSPCARGAFPRCGSGLVWDCPAQGACYGAKAVSGTPRS